MDTASWVSPRVLKKPLEAGLRVFPRKRGKGAGPRAVGTGARVAGQPRVLLRASRGSAAAAFAHVSQRPRGEPRKPQPGCHPQDPKCLWPTALVRAASRFPADRDMHR